MLLLKSNIKSNCQALHFYQFSDILYYTRLYKMHTLQCVLSQNLLVTESKSMSHTGCVLLFSLLMCIQYVWHTAAHISEWGRNSVQLLMSVMGINNRRQACGS